MSVNLARRPFANTRPLRRVGALLWVLGAALALLAGYLYWGSLFGIESKQAELAGIERAMAAERRRLAAAEAGLARMNLRRQNQEAAFLNARIAERTFPWSALFDQLAGVLPRQVRLFSLAPKSVETRGRRGGATRPAAAATGGPRRVYLQMNGAAESDEALLLLLDNLFASPAFEAPSLPRELRDERGVLQFLLNVFYLPDAPTVGEEAAVEELAPGAKPGQAARPSGAARPAAGGAAAPMSAADGREETQ